MNKLRPYIISLVIIIAAAGFYLFKTQMGSAHYFPEGMFRDINFRDVGASMNDCLHQAEMRTDLLFRSSRYFSGLSCKTIGNPDKLFTLNFLDRDRLQYYCVKPDGTYLFGHYENQHKPVERLDLINNWEDRDFLTAVCATFSEVFVALSQSKRTTIHCDAGRDRTGAFIALLLAAMEEVRGDPGQEAFYKAAECDYEKTKSLSPEKIGRMLAFLEDLKKSGGAAAFLEQKCAIKAPVIATAASAFFRPK